MTAENTVEKMEEITKKLKPETVSQLEIIIQQAAYNLSGPESLAFMARELKFRGLEKYFPDNCPEQIQTFGVMLQLLKIYKFLEPLDEQIKGAQPIESDSKSIYR